MKIPFVDLKTTHKTIAAEILSRWEDILDTCSFVDGKHVQAFEKEFAQACKARYCVLVNSGTDALRIIFKALGLQAQSEVITAPNTFIATTETITQAFAKPIFVDIVPDTYTIDPELIEKAITPATKGIVPVHLYGQPADMDPIQEIAKRHGLWVIEDACQAHLAQYKGKMVGTLGVAGAFSFYPGKNLGACGEGGAIVTNEKEIAEKALILRNHGQVKKYHHYMEGYNARCDEIQAAALRVKLKKLHEWNETRSRNAVLYRKYLSASKKLIPPVQANYAKHVYHLFVVLVENRDYVQEVLSKKGVATGLHYPIPLHLQQAYRHLGLGPGSFPIAEECAQKLLSLPMHPELNEEQIKYVAASLNDIIENM